MLPPKIDAETSIFVLERLGSFCEGRGSGSSEFMGACTIIYGPFPSIFGVGDAGCSLVLQGMRSFMTDLFPFFGQRVKGLGMLLDMAKPNSIQSSLIMCSPEVKP